MEDHERLGNGPNNMAGCKRSSPESPCSRSNNNNNNNKEQDRFLPIANVGRIMKKVIPGNGKISKDAKETVQECVSEFISFITGEASDKCQREKRKTINGDDIIWAITTLGFDEYVEPLKNYLHKYRELEGDKSAGTTPVVVGNVLPKQQQYQDHQQNQPLLHHLPNNYDPTATSSVYTPPSAASLLSQQPIPFMPTDPPFPLPFPPNSIQTTQHLAALHQQDRFDSLGPW